MDIHASPNVCLRLGKRASVSRLCRFGEGFIVEPGILRRWLAIFRTFSSKMWVCYHVCMNVTRRMFLQGALVASAEVAFGIPKTAQTRPNVVFIYADDLGKGMLSRFGQRRFSTPNIDRIFAEGATFDFAHGCMYCAPARASLLTGYHDAHRQVPWRIAAASMPEAETDAADRLLPNGERYLPEIFRAAGYVTAQVGKLGYSFRTTRRQMERYGWDFYYGYLDHQACHGFYPPFLWRKPEGKAPIQETLPGNTHPDGAKSGENETYAQRLRRWDMKGKAIYAPDRFIAEAEAFLQRRGQDRRPFFLHYATTLPHGPVQIPPSSRRYEGFGATEHTFWPAIDPEVAARNKRLCYWDDVTGKPLSPPPPHNAEGLTDLEMEYASMVRRLDAEVGRLLETLERLGLADNTMVLFASDNGHELYTKQLHGKRCLKGVARDYSENFHDVFNGNAGLRGLKWDNRQGGIGIPFAIRWPTHVSPGSTVPDLVAMYDLLPTFAEMLAVPLRRKADGRSLLPLLRGEHFPPSRTVIANGSGGHPTLLRNDRWKLRGKELFNLADDPRETTNLAARYPQRVDAMRKELQEAIK